MKLHVLAAILMALFAGCRTRAVQPQEQENFIVRGIWKSPDSKANFIVDIFNPRGQGVVAFTVAAVDPQGLLRYESDSWPVGEAPKSCRLWAAGWKVDVSPSGGDWSLVDSPEDIQWEVVE